MLPRLDAAALETCLAHWTQDRPQGDAALALDGKTVRGAGAAGQQAPQPLSVSTHDQAETLAQQSIDQGGDSPVVVTETHPHR